MLGGVLPKVQHFFPSGFLHALDLGSVAPSVLPTLPSAPYHPQGRNWASGIPAYHFCTSWGQSQEQAPPSLVERGCGKVVFYTKLWASWVSKLGHHLVQLPCLTEKETEARGKAGYRPELGIAHEDGENRSVRYHAPPQEGVSPALPLLSGAQPLLPVAPRSALGPVQSPQC